MTEAFERFSLEREVSQSAFVRGFIDDLLESRGERIGYASLNPRSCAASSMTDRRLRFEAARVVSQSAFVRGFIDDWPGPSDCLPVIDSLNPRSCAASSMTTHEEALALAFAGVSIRVRARLHR